MTCAQAIAIKLSACLWSSQSNRR